MVPNKREFSWQAAASKLFCALVAGVGIGWIFKHAVAVPVILAIAWAVAAIIDPLARATERRLKIPARVCAVVYVLLLLLLLGTLLFLLVGRLLRELRALMTWMGENPAWIGQKIGALLSAANKLFADLPLWVSIKAEQGLAELGASVDTMMSGLLRDTVSGIGSFVTLGIGRLLRAAPKLLILLVVTVMACVYGSMDYGRIRNFVIALLPSHWAKRVDRFRKKAGRAVRRYLRAYGILWLLTLCEVLVGLWILKQPYALLIAIIVATVDLLPILGAGTVLIPWAILQLLLGHHSFGIGLLILYGVLTIVRQIAEPHVVGESLGIHPLASLLCMVLGLQLFGVVGMLLGPIAALVGKEWLVARRQEDRDSA